MICCHKRLTLALKTHRDWEWLDRKSYFKQSITKPNQKRVTTVISDKIDFKLKMVKRDKEGHYIMIKGSIHQEDITRASLVAQWLRICLPMQGTWVRALVWEDPTCCEATGSMSHNYWACASGACAPQQERPRQWEACAPRWRVAPTRRN